MDRNGQSSLRVPADCILLHTSLKSCKIDPVKEIIAEDKTMREHAGKKRFFAAVCLVMFTVSFGNAMQGVLLTDFIDFYKLNGASQGFISVAQSVGCLIISVSLIFIAGKVRRSTCLMFLCAAMGVSLSLAGTKVPFAALLVLYVLFGIGYAGGSNVGSSLSSELFTGSAAAMGVAHACNGIGGLLGPVVLRRARLQLPWTSVCFLHGGIILAVFVFYLVNERTSQKVIGSLQEKGNRITRRDVLHFLSKRRNLLLMTAGFGYMAFQNGLVVWTTRYADIVMNVGRKGAYLLTGFWIGTTAARLLVTRLKIRTERLFAAGNLCAAAVFFLGGISRDFRVMMVCMSAAGFASGASMPQIYHMGCTWNTENSLLPTSVLAITMFASSIITAPVTASAASKSLPLGMLTVFVYIAVSGAALVPVAFRRSVKAGG